MSTEVAVAFTIRGEGLDHDRLTRTIGIRPTDTWSSGDVLPGTTRPLRQDGWRYKIGPEEATNFEDSLAKMLDLIRPKIDVISRLTQTASTTIDLSFQALVEDVQPYLRLENDDLKVLGTAGVAIELDFIAIAPESP